MEQPAFRKAPLENACVDQRLFMNAKLTVSHNISTAEEKPRNCDFVRKDGVIKPAFVS